MQITSKVVEITTVTENLTIILTHYFPKSLGPLRIISKYKLIHDPRGHDQPYCIGALSTFLISMKLVYKLYGFSNRFDG